MQFIKSMKISTQLLAGFSAVLVLLVGLGAFAAFEVSSENEHVARLRDDWLPAVRTAEGVAVALGNVRLGQYRTAGSQSPAEFDDAKTTMDGILAAWKQALDAYAAHAKEPQAQAAWDEIQQKLPQYMAYTQQVLDLAKAGEKNDAHNLLTGPAYAMYGEINTRIQTIVAINEAGAAREGKAAADAYSRAMLLIVLFIVAAVIAGAAIAAVIARALTTQLGGEPRDAVAVAGAIAAGNLRAPVPVKPGDTSSLMYSLSAMKSHLGDIVRGIKTSSETISVAASEIAQGNTDLSSRTEEQAASLEQTASSMEELTGTVQRNTDNAKQAALMATDASGIAARGGEVVSHVVDTMNGISESSSKVAEIIVVIESIAFQTNILALNAAVEAARAGEQGRGFAVVASEVRSLAQRSATAAKEIKDLIGESVDRVDVGTRLVAEAGGTIGEIVLSVRKVTDLVQEIAAASGQQSIGINQVNQAVSQMDQVTQQNAALVEQAAAAAQSMSQQAQALREAVAVFSVDERDGRRGVGGSEPGAFKGVAAPARKPRPVVAPAPRVPKPVRVQAAVSESADWQTF
ncbi:methyl-accepting chemotaxis protein [Paraburkholderia caballeronis]|uniref:Methyl-accepting chemotaxis protein n=2 Tax=Paraburkholderia caballeronis TaxID=416943 RepID=A0A1H7S972_9BURK|nr:methyl-accepting chemotaxis protein [Paraburkholderia caballeronis]PXW97328.1 methyl-accepting chemotaxis protein [Paraburkholderia caballeronis]RAJ93848.1 methyl-accepting chemotaxis protein [Paraburkholderia caballeronis]SED55405.1 methyl-accepting chemotaxis protein [Paraburkholderia caballeronis]SEL68756.1 methyl-accepting chemotaxis protein [Paraburkholderia caballeronis]